MHRYHFSSPDYIYIYSIHRYFILSLRLRQCVLDTPDRFDQPTKKYGTWNCRDSLPNAIVLFNGLLVVSLWQKSDK